MICLAIQDMVNNELFMKFKTSLETNSIMLISEIVGIDSYIGKKKRYLNSMRGRGLGNYEYVFDDIQCGVIILKSGVLVQTRNTVEELVLQLNPPILDIDEINDLLYDDINEIGR